MAVSLAAGAAQASTTHPSTEVTASVGTPVVSLESYTSSGQLTRHETSSAYSAQPFGFTVGLTFDESRRMRATYTGEEPTVLKVSMPVELTGVYPHTPYMVTFPVRYEASAGALIEGSFSTWKGDELLTWRDVGLTKNATSEGPIVTVGTATLAPDQAFDRIELAYFIREGGQSAGPASASVEVYGMGFALAMGAVPEPAAMSTMMLGLIGLAAMARSTRRST